MALKDLVLNPHLSTVPAYTPGKSIEELKRELGVAEVIKLGSNENPLGPSPKAVEAMKQAALEMSQYPSVEVYDLRGRLAELLGPGFDADNVIVGNGSADVIMSMAKAFLYDGGEVVVSHPAFQMYELATNMYGGKCVFVDSKNYGYDLPAMADKITSQTRMIYITNPNNPTGLIVTQAEIDDFMERVPPSVVVVFDEAYYEYVDAQEYPDTLQCVKEDRNVVITRTFSKVYGLAGMRVGYGIASKEIIGYLLHTQPPFHTGRIALVSALTSLEDQEHMEKSQKVNAEGKAYLYRSFEEMGVDCLPTQANYLMLVNLPYPAQSINQALLRQGLIIRPTAPFGIPEALRLTIGTPEQNQRLVAGFKEAFAELDSEKLTDLPH
jgi:histidinol-phosphate aminotransferase